MNLGQVWDEDIVNPVCPSCLRKELEDWADNKKMVSKLYNFIYNYGLFSTHCEICGSEMSIPAGDFCNGIKDWLELRDQALVESFSEHFDFMRGIT